MNKTELARELAHRMHLGGDDYAVDTATYILNLLFGERGIIADAITRGELVTITGFGQFRRVKVGLRDVVPPRQGMVVQPGMAVNEHYRAAFRAGDTLARRVWPDKKPASIDDWPESAA